MNLNISALTAGRLRTGKAKTFMQKTRCVPTIPWKGNGGNESMQNAFLIPIGAALEEIPGICHLFEHLLIRRLLKYVEDVAGYTTEDYMIFICNDLSPIDFVEQTAIHCPHT